MSYQRVEMYVNESKWISNGNQNMIVSISYGIPKQSQGNRCEIKHKIHAYKLGFYKNMQKCPILAFKHQNGIQVYIENLMELYENERTQQLIEIIHVFFLSQLISSVFLPSSFFLQLFPSEMPFSFWTPFSHVQSEYFLAFPWPSHALVFFFPLKIPFFPMPKNLWKLGLFSFFQSILFFPPLVFQKSPSFPMQSIGSHVALHFSPSQSPLFFCASPLLPQLLMQPHWVSIGNFKVVMSLVIGGRKEWARYRYVEDDASKVALLIKPCMTVMQFLTNFSFLIKKILSFFFKKLFFEVNKIK